MHRAELAAICVVCAIVVVAVVGGAVGWTLTRRPTLQNTPSPSA
jgi:hypothetical protein